jgi:hypothetical protein
VAAAAVAVATMPVMVVGRAVDTDPDADPSPDQAIEGRLVEHHAVGLHPDRDLAAGRHGGPYLLGQADQAVGSSQERFAAVQDDSDPGEAVPFRMFGDPDRSGPPGVPGHQRWTIAPGLVGQLVDIAVVAGQVAALVHLEDEFPEGGRSPAAGADVVDVKPAVRPSRVRGWA